MSGTVIAAEAACLGAALAWAISLTMFRGLITAHGASRFVSPAAEFERFFTLWLEIEVDGGGNRA